MCRCPVSTRLSVGWRTCTQQVHIAFQSRRHSLAPAFRRERDPSRWSIFQRAAHPVRTMHRRFGSMPVCNYLRCRTRNRWIHSWRFLLAISCICSWQPIVEIIGSKGWTSSRFIKCHVSNQETDESYKWMMILCCETKTPISHVRKLVKSYPEASPNNGSSWPLTFDHILASGIKGIFSAAFPQPRLLPGM